MAELVAYLERMTELEPHLPPEERSALQAWYRFPHFSRDSDWPGWVRYLGPRPVSRSPQAIDAENEVRMSDLARNYVRGLLLRWPLKSVLLLIADFHNVKEGRAWPGLETLARIMQMDERNLRRIIRQLEQTKKLRYVPGIGRGNLGSFYFLDLEKGVPGDRFGDGKGGTKEVTKAVISDSVIRDEPLTSEPGTNQHACGAVKDWLRIKADLENKLTPDEVGLWLRPMYLLKVMSGNTLLLAVPPNRQIMQTALANRDMVNEAVQLAGYACCVLTPFPGEYDRERLQQEFPDLAAKMYQCTLFESANRHKASGLRDAGASTILFRFTASVLFMGTPRRWSGGKQSSKEENNFNDRGCSENERTGNNQDNTNARRTSSARRAMGSPGADLWSVVFLWAYGVRSQTL